MGRTALLTNEQQAMLRAEFSEAPTLRKRIAEDKARLAQLTIAGMARKYGVTESIVKRVLFGPPYVVPQKLTDDEWKAACVARSHRR